jgi:hypothetical protein
MYEELAVGREELDVNRLTIIIIPCLFLFIKKISLQARMYEELAVRWVAQRLFEES